MIRLQIHPDQVDWLADELAAAGNREVGGVLVGEHVADAIFRIADLSVQRSGGTLGCFVCDSARHQAFLDDFFRRTNQDFARFNYLGEWHSHPLFSVAPSGTDVRQMQQLVEDEEDGLHFAVLMIIRLTARSHIEGAAFVFRPRQPPTSIIIETVARPLGDEQLKRRTWWRRHFGPQASVRFTPKLIPANDSSRRDIR